MLSDLFKVIEVTNIRGGMDPRNYQYTTLHKCFRLLQNKVLQEAEGQTSKGFMEGVSFEFDSKG